MSMRAQSTATQDATPDWWPSKYGAEDQTLNIRDGVVVVENLRLQEAARDHVNEFLIGFGAHDAADPADLGRHSMDFWLTTEDLPLPGNQVTLGRDGQIRLRYTQTNAEAHRRLIAKFKSLLSAMQCREDVLPGYSYTGGRLGISAVAHQNGTVRFGTDPATSALDLNCKMHELDNLYVVDSSFFVSSTAVNPTLTIIANALRVADRIAERLGVTGREEARPTGSLMATTGAGSHQALPS